MEAKETRRVMLEQAIALTCGDRNESYGPPKKNLSDCAALWTAYLRTKYSQPDAVILTAEDVAWLNVLQKIARTYRAATFDNYIDAAAYAAIAGECRGNFT